MEVATVGSPALWVGFIALIIVLLAVDLGLFHRGAKTMKVREAAFFSVLWVSLALLFNLGVYHFFNKETALEFLAGYLIELSLSVDNIFIFIVIFSYFKVAEAYRHRVLFYGILGAIIMRGLFIFLGAELLARFHFIMYGFGVLLIFTGIKMLFKEEEETDLEKSKVLIYAKKLIPSTNTFHGERFFIREGGKLLATPLFFVLLIVEVTDLVFAIDSIPAVFAITSDPFIVFTSNIFAILGLRSMFFVLSAGLAKLEYLRLGLAAVLSFVGVKMILADIYKIPTEVSLGVIVFFLGATVAASLIKLRKQNRQQGNRHD